MKRDSFLYQINFNRKKFPEICEALEEAKEENGVAWYLRHLISKDIEEKKYKKKMMKMIDSHEDYAHHDETAVKSIEIEDKHEDKKVEEIDKSGGFL